MLFEGVQVDLHDRWLPQSTSARAIVAVLCLLLWCAPASSAQDEQPEAPQSSALRFLEGLRQRGYYDSAIEYLDEITADASLPSDVRQVLDFERGITLQQMGAAARVPEDRELLLSRAEESLRKFVSEAADHPQAAFANSSLGELLFERARTLIWQTESPSQADRKVDLQQQSRKLIDDAEIIYKKAYDLYERQYKAFPTYIDAAKDPEPFQQRLDAEAKFLRAWFNLSRCAYERGQTYDKGSEERKKTLIKASELFEAIHTSRRTNAIGLNARLMMGKCFQEQDDFGRALGIYNEMLGHKSDHPSVMNLRNIALHYRLICLNDPRKADYQVALQEATEWVAANKSRLATPTGLGILWEKAVAMEKLADDRTIDPKQREVLLRQTVQDSQLVARYPGAFREPATAMNRRVKAALGDKDKEPRDFETAFERARGMIDQIQKLKDEADAAPDEATKQQKLTAFDLHLNEVGRLLKLALDLSDESTDPKALAQTRYLLSFVYFRQRRNLDAVILAGYCMTRDRVADPDTALNATEIAITAAVQAWNDAEGGNRDFETSLLRDVCIKVLELYPQSSRGTEARIRLGRVYQQLQNPVEAAKWFLQVPENDPQYATARISAGQSFWLAYTNASTAESDDDLAQPKSAADLAAMKNEAKQLLMQGIQAARAGLAADARPADDVIAAEVSLASILNLDGEFATTIERLSAGGEQSVLKFIDVPEGTKRPESGIQSSSFAGLTYRLLLRAYVGSQQIDEALKTMSKLEKVGGQDITAVYTQLGMELQEELQRLKQAGAAQRLTEVRDSFEKFLARVYEQRNATDYNSLLWIGETYFGLGQGVAEDISAAAAYYDKAANAYNEIIQGGLAQEPTLTAIRLRLARCRRQQKQFEQAYQITHEILTANPLALDAQFEAALILSDWGSSGPPEKLMDAVQGVKDANGLQIVWGWANIAKRLQQTLAREPSEDFKNRFFESRYQLSNCRRRYAATGSADASTQLKSAQAEIIIFTQVARDIDDTWWARFDRLYQDIQTDLGESPKPLERVVVTPAAPEPAVVSDTSSEGDPASEANAENADTPAVEAQSPESGGMLMPILALAIAAAGAAGVYLLMSKPQKRVRTAYTAPGSGTAGGSFEGLDFSVGGSDQKFSVGNSAGSISSTATRPRQSARTVPGTSSAPKTSSGKPTGSPPSTREPSAPRRPVERPAAPRRTSEGQAGAGGSSSGKPTSDRESGAGPERKATARPVRPKPPSESGPEGATGAGDGTKPPERPRRPKPPENPS